VPFWTSDNPVTLFNPVDYGEAGGLGFNVRGIQTHFPLNSSLLLLILDPTSYDMPPIKIVKEDNVDWENELQLYNATRFVFSPARDFSKAKKMWEKDENLRKPHDRIVIHTSEGPRSSFIRTTRNRTHHPT
jgi:hypothetical protein